MIYPFTNTIGKMKVSQAMKLINFISIDWHLNIRCIPAEQKMLSFGNSFTVANRIIKNSARNN